MSLDISEILAKLDTLEAHYKTSAINGLNGVATEAQTEMQANTAHGNITWATRTSYRAYVVYPDHTGATILAGAVASVESHNPGHSATAPFELNDRSVGVVLTVPTNYQVYLETLNAGLRAVLGPTFAAKVNECTQRAAKGS